MRVKSAEDALAWNVSEGIRITKAEDRFHSSHGSIGANPAENGSRRADIYLDRLNNQSLVDLSAYPAIQTKCAVGQKNVPLG